ncbi:unnamed protein product, partial [Strongylus vulgaris]
MFEIDLKWFKDGTLPPPPHFSLGFNNPSVPAPPLPFPQNGPRLNNNSADGQGYPQCNGSVQQNVDIRVPPIGMPIANGFGASGMYHPPHCGAQHPAVNPVVNDPSALKGLGGASNISSVPDVPPQNQNPNNSMRQNVQPSDDEHLLQSQSIMLAKIKLQVLVECEMRALANNKLRMLALVPAQVGKKHNR